MADTKAKPGMLIDIRNLRVADCPYGVQKRVELGRALAMEPRLLLLDEPASGLTAEEKEEVAYWLHEVRGLNRGLALNCAGLVLFIIVWTTMLMKVSTMGIMHETTLSSGPMEQLLSLDGAR